MAKNTNSTAVTNPNAVVNNITLPQPGGEEKLGPKLTTVEVGPFRLPGVQVDFNQFTPEQVQEMLEWARENGAYVAEDRGMFSWKKAKLRDWFILRWT